MSDYDLQECCDCCSLGMKFRSEGHECKAHRHMGLPCRHVFFLCCEGGVETQERGHGIWHAVKEKPALGATSPPKKGMDRKCRHPHKPKKKNPHSQHYQGIVCFMPRGESIPSMHGRQNIRLRTRGDLFSWHLKEAGHPARLKNGLQEQSAITPCPACLLNSKRWSTVPALVFRFALPSFVLVFIASSLETHFSWNPNTVVVKDYFAWMMASSLHIKDAVFDWMEKDGKIQFFQFFYDLFLLFNGLCRWINYVTSWSQTFFFNLTYCLCFFKLDNALSIAQNVQRTLIFSSIKRVTLFPAWKHTLLCLLQCPFSCGLNVIWRIRDVAPPDGYANCEVTECFTSSLVALSEVFYNRQLFAVFLFPGIGPPPCSIVCSLLFLFHKHAWE